MDTLIVFSGRYGSAKKSAEYLNRRLRGSLVIDLAENEPNPEGFANIAVGGSVYNGRLCAPLRKFLSDNRKILEKKSLQIWINCVTRQSFNQAVSQDIPKVLRGRAQNIIFAGGILPQSVSLADRLRFIPLQRRIAGLPAFSIDYAELDKIAFTGRENRQDDETDGGQE